ncbi:MAG: 50S ribosomal protein L28 [Candidatus Auribacterota bacterium]|jgi:large subunit ribosomal protein L28|nr:50S ribosomal protein L28 [Candidatus Auribacterota bacterium]
MSRECDLCGKGPHAGRSIARRGMAKKKGGVGKNITGITKRRFLPNLQSVKIVDDTGAHRRIRACTACIRSGKITKVS